MNPIIAGIVAIIGGIIVVASCWRDNHILAPLAIIGGGAAIIAGLILIICGLMS